MKTFIDRKRFIHVKSYCDITAVSSKLLALLANYYVLFVHTFLSTSPRNITPPKGTDPVLVYI